MAASFTDSARATACQVKCRQTSWMSVNKLLSLKGRPRMSLLPFLWAFLYPPAVGGLSANRLSSITEFANLIDR